MSEVPLYGTWGGSAKCKRWKNYLAYERGSTVHGEAVQNVSDEPKQHLAAGNAHHVQLYRGTSITRNSPLLEPYRGPMPRVLGGS